MGAFLLKGIEMACKGKKTAMAPRPPRRPKKDNGKKTKKA
jgi:hypothetical protein